MGDYDWEVKDTLEKIVGALVNIARVLEDIRDKMVPQEGEYSND